MAVSGQGKGAPWMRWTLTAAGLYNLAWAASLVSSPSGLLHWMGAAASGPEALWRALGLGAGVLGIGCLLAASCPLRHWPVVLMGLAGNLGGAYGLGMLAYRGEAPVTAAWLVAVSGLAWCAPFALILHAAYEATLQQRRVLSPEIVRMAMRRRTNQGITLDEMSSLSPVLIVFLRHAGCTFCREALADLAARRREIEAQGTRLTLVHMGTEEHGARFFAKYGLANVPRVSDPERSLYRAFGLPRGGFGGLLGPKVWWRGFQTAIVRRHGVGLLAGDGLQMPGVFLIFHGEVLRGYRHQSAADRPNYVALVTGREYTSPEFSA